MADVFISYHRSESASALVARIVGELESAGISCWYDTKDPKLGYFTDVIAEEIEQCKVFILLWDKGANESRYCISETHYAFSYAKNALIVPFQVGKFERSRKLAFLTVAFQILFGGESAETAHTDELIKKIAAEIGPPPQPATQAQPLPTKPPTPKIDPPPAKIIKRGECGDNVTYTLDANGVLTISGEGPMRDFPLYENISRSTPWWYECETISRARILNGVTSIGDYSFWRCARLVSVDIPDSVTEIGWGAFWQCESLASVDIPNSVTEIGWGAFYGCKNLKRVSVPAEAKCSYAFDDHTQVIRRPRK